MKQFKYAYYKNDSTLIVNTSLKLADSYYDSSLRSNVDNIDSAIFYYNIAERLLPSQLVRYPIYFNTDFLNNYYYRGSISDTGKNPINKIPFLYYIKLKLINLQIKAGKEIKSSDIEELITLSDSTSSLLLLMPVSDGSNRTISNNEAEIKEQDYFIESERKEKETLKYYGTILIFLLIGTGIAIFKAMKSNKLLKNALEDNIQSQKVIREQDLKLHEEQLAKITVEQEIKVLRAQMNPHFIFNALNSIHNCILNKDTITASNNLTKFSKLIRRILDNTRNTICSLNEEIATLEIYVELEKMRFDGNFQFNINVDLELTQDETYIPTLIIQPFIENSIWHGLMPSPRSGIITLNVLADEQLLIISIEDNGVGRDYSRLNNEPKTHNSVGLTLTAERIRYFNEGLPIDNPLRIIDLFDSYGRPTGTRVEIILKRYEKI